MPKRDTSLAAIRERYRRIGQPGLSDTAYALSCASSAHDVDVLLERLGAKEDPDPELGFTPPMIISEGDCEILASCGDCATPLGSIRPDGNVATFFLNWERHVMADHR